MFAFLYDSAVLVLHRIIASTAVRDNVFGMKPCVLLLSRVADIPSSISQSPVLWNAELIRRLCVLRCLQIHSDGSVAAPQHSIPNDSHQVYLYT
jgi:hypothetical protein